VPFLYTEYDVGAEGQIRDPTSPSNRPANLDLLKYGARNLPDKISPANYLSYHMPVGAPCHRYGFINRLKVFDQGLCDSKSKTASNIPICGFPGPSRRQGYRTPGRSVS